MHTDEVPREIPPAAREAEPPDDDAIQAAIDYEAEKRLWLKSIIPLLQLRSHDSDPSGRVQLAFDMMHISACERVARLMRSDLPQIKED